MKSLITGGAGFIGSHLAETLLERNEEVFILDDLSTGTFYNIAHLEDHPKFHYEIDTVLDAEIVDKLVSQVDVVYHLAAAVGVEYIIDNPLKMLQVNIRGTENVLDSANRGKKKVVIASTSEIYGKNNTIPFKESDDRLLGSTTISRWGYSTSKAVDEFLALAYWRMKKLPTVIIRFFNVIGPRQTGDYGMVVPKFVKQALLGHPIYVYGDGNQSRCFGYIDDIVDGINKLAHHSEAVGEIFNLGSDQEIMIKELATLVRDLVDSDSEIEFIPYEKAYEQGFEDMSRRVPDLTKVQNLIDYNPKTSLEEMIRKIIEFYER